MLLFLKEPDGRYVTTQPATDQQIIDFAIQLTARRVRRGAVLSTPAKVREHLQLTLGGRPNESFWGLFLDSQNHLLAVEELFRGTVNQTAVYPRVIIKRALDLNAAAVIVAHNHPSGLTEPSQSDCQLTDTLKAALMHMDIKLLDHLVVTTEASMSFAERGLL